MLDKLRENLKGNALKRVPATVKDIDIAWKNLEEAFGSALVILKERLKSLSKLGSIPPDSNALKQINWYLDFESVLQDIVDLGDSDDLNLQMGAFGPPVQELILKAFIDDPTKNREVAKAGHGKGPKEKMVSFKDKIVEYRKDAQLAEVESGHIESSKKGSKSENNDRANFGSSTPSRYDDCKICNEIQSRGNPDGLDLFENHSGENTYQCPTFMSLNVKERINVIKKLKICSFCLDNKTATNRAHEDVCKDKKTRFSHLWKCSSPGCGRHSWVCSVHADNANKSKLADYAKKLSRKGLQFSTIGIVSLNARFPDTSAFKDLEKRVDKELVPSPEGQPTFLFYSAKGKTRPVRVFFDSGCSRFIMRDCIPEKELPASLIRKGKFPIGGVGESIIYAESEYMVAMDTLDGRAQVLQGLTVKSITSEFPELDVTAAVAEVVAACPKNMQLKKCKFPRTVGGKIDCLIGIQYNQLQPVPVHMLPSGLAIYKTKLSPHHAGYNYVVGGPHSSLMQCWPKLEMLTI